MVNVYWVNFFQATFYRGTLDSLVNPTSISNPIQITGYIPPPLICGVRVDEVNSQMYWIERNTAGVFAGDVNLTTNVMSNIRLLGNIGGTPQDLFIDKINSKIYMTRSNSILLRGDLDSITSPTSISNVIQISTATSSNLSTLFLDQINSKMYTMQQSIFIEDLSGTTLSNLSTLGSSPQVRNNGLTVDVINKKVYWVSPDSASVYAADLNGPASNPTSITNPTVISGGLGNTLNAPWGFDIPSLTAQQTGVQK